MTPPADPPLADPRLADPPLAGPAGRPARRGAVPLSELVRRETLQTLQERFTELGQVSLAICTVEGDLITRPTWGSLYSAMIGTSRPGRAEFAAAIRRHGREAGKDAAFTCLEGMTVTGTPIAHRGRRLAFIIVGTRTIVPDRPAAEAIARRYELEPGALGEAAATINPYGGGTPEAIRRFADVLADTIASLYGQALRIERQLADLRVVYGVAELLAGTRDLQEILDATVRRVDEVLPVKACGIRLLNEQTGELVIKAVHNLSEEYLRKGPVMLRDSAIDGEAFAGKTVYIEDATSDSRIRYPENARREGIVSGLCVPMTYRGRTVGVMRVYTARRYVFSAPEKALLRAIGSQAAAAVINTRLYEERTEAEHTQRQVRAAGDIQRRMLPAALPRHRGLEFGCVYVPTLQLGGDFYDFIDLPEGRLGVCIADVVGKGVPAALLMAAARSALRAYAGNGGDPVPTMALVNRHLCRDTLVGEFVTLAYGVFSPDGRTFTYCDAGHTPPLLLRGDDFVELTCGGLVLGVLPDTVFEQETLTLRPGDTLVMTTDGVSEAMDFHGNTYGGQRLRASIRKHAGLATSQLAQQLLWDVRRYVGLADQSDDISIVVVRVH